RARVSTLSTNVARPSFCKAFRARMVDDWRALHIDIIDNRSSGGSSLGARPRPIGQDHGTRDHPVELAIADNSFLHVLVVIDASQQQTKRHVEKPVTFASEV